MGMRTIVRVGLVALAAGCGGPVVDVPAGSGWWCAEDGFCARPDTLVCQPGTAGCTTHAQTTAWCFATCADPRCTSCWSTAARCEALRAQTLADPRDDASACVAEP